MLGITFKDFVDEILSYESDTFSAECDKITRKEAVRVARIMLLSWRNHDLDGIMISDVLEHIRETRKRGK